LESVCRRNPTVGSNPTLSATIFIYLEEWGERLNATVAIKSRTAALGEAGWLSVAAFEARSG
jgi:hypothetical protein